MGSLFKQLVIALGLFIRHHVSRMFAPRGKQTGESEAGDHRQADVAATRDVPAAPITAPAPPPPSPGLDSAYVKPMAWQTEANDASPSGETANPIHELWREMPRGHKWTHYFEIYQAVFDSRRTKPMRILEIGVFQGASLQLWKRYFQHAETRVIGVDIDPACAVYDAPSEGIHVRIGSQTDGEFLAGVVSEFGPFDLIIDDGSHFSTHMIKSFNCLYASGLKDDGIYFVEDLHANYWRPWRDSEDSFLDFCKNLVELMHAHYWKNALAVWTEQLRSGALLTVEVPEITTMIEEIRFFDSVVAIYKTRRRYAPRYVVA